MKNVQLWVDPCFERFGPPEKLTSCWKSFSNFVSPGVKGLEVRKLVAVIKWDGRAGVKQKASKGNKVFITDQTLTIAIYASYRYSQNAKFLTKNCKIREARFQVFRLNSSEKIYSIYRFLLIIRTT